MNRQTKELIDKLNEKLSICTDELSQLLDLIYKFPQKQRQRYCDRIQLLRQNITQLKVCLKDSQTTINITGISKKYQQILMKITELKNQVNSLEPIKKRKNYNYNSNDIENVIEKKQYNQIMQTIVNKNEQVHKFERQLKFLKNQLNQLSQNKIQNQAEIKTMKYELQQTKQNVFKLERAKNDLQRELKQTNIKCHALQQVCCEYKQSKQSYDIQIRNLNRMLSQSNNLQSHYKLQAQKFARQLAAFEQKYKYDMKDSLLSLEQYKSKQKIQQKKIKDFQNQLQNLSGSDIQNKQLIIQNARLLQDIQVLEAQLVSKEQNLYQKNRKLQSQKNEIIQFINKNEILQKIVQQKQKAVSELLLIQKENQNVIHSLQRKLNSSETKILQLQETKLIQSKMNQQNCKKSQAQKEKNDKLFQELFMKISQKQQQIKFKNNYIAEYQKKLQLVCEEKMNLQKQNNKILLEHAQTLQRISKINSTFDLAERQKNKAKQKIVEYENVIANSQQEQIKLKSQIYKLKKQFLKAKIQTIHNIREIIL